MLVNMYKMRYKVCFELYIIMEWRNVLDRGFYGEVMMCIYCYVVGEAWYDV